MGIFHKSVPITISGDDKEPFFTQEEILFIAIVLGGKQSQTRQSAIDNMQTILSANIISGWEREAIKGCVLKLGCITDEDFNDINFLSAALG